MRSRGVQRSSRRTSKLRPSRFRPPQASRRTTIRLERVPGRRDWTRDALVEGVRAGDWRALARAITLVENSEPLAYEVVQDLYGETGRAYTIGVTGPPEVG